MIYVSDKCIPNEAVSTSGRRWGGGVHAVFPTGIDRCLFVFAIGPDSINPACVMITVPPCQQVSKKRDNKRGRGGRREEVLAVGTMRRGRVGGGRGGVKMGLFNTHLADVKP